MIHVIHPNVRQYLTYVLDSKDARKKLGQDTKFHFDQRPIAYASQWQPLEISFAKAAGVKKAVMPDLMIRNGRLFLNEKAHQALHALLTPCGEWLPVNYGDEKGYLFNILALADDVDGLDSKLCSKNSFGELQSLGFIEERVQSLAVFRTAYDAYMGAYCNDAFHDAVEAAGLQGLIFSVDLGNVFPPDPKAKSPVKH